MRRQTRVQRAAAHRAGAVAPAPPAAPQRCGDRTGCSRCRGRAAFCRRAAGSAARRGSARHAAPPWPRSPAAGSGPAGARGVGWAAQQLDCCCGQQWCGPSQRVAARGSSAAPRAPQRGGGSAGARATASSGKSKSLMTSGASSAAATSCSITSSGVLRRRRRGRRQRCSGSPRAACASPAGVWLAHPIIITTLGSCTAARRVSSDGVGGLTPISFCRLPLTRVRSCSAARRLPTVASRGSSTCSSWPAHFTLTCGARGRSASRRVASRRVASRRVVSRRAALALALLRGACRERLRVRRLGGGGAAALRCRCCVHGRQRVLLTRRLDSRRRLQGSAGLAAGAPKKHAFRRSLNASTPQGVAASASAARGGRPRGRRVVDTQRGSAQAFFWGAP